MANTAKLSIQATVGTFRLQQNKWRLLASHELTIQASELLAFNTARVKRSISQRAVFRFSLN